MNRVGKLFFRSKLFAIAVLNLLLLAQQPAHAAVPAWSAPATLGTSSLYYMYGNNVSVAVSAHPQAQSVAVWTEPSTMAIKYAIRRNGVWTSAKTLATANATALETVTDPQVVIDPSGTATAVWGSTKQGAMQYCYSGLRIYRCPEIISYAKAATLAPGATTWSKANLSAKGVAVAAAQVGMDQAGNAVAMWSYKLDSASSPQLQSAFRRAGVWSAPVAIGSAAAFSLPRLAVGVSGAAVAVWGETLAGTTPASYAVKSAYLSPGATAWDLAQNVTVRATPVAYLRAAVDGNGQAAAVWDNNYSVQWAHRSTGVWSVPETLVSAPGRSYSGTGPYAAYGPDIAADGLGNFLITWLENDVLQGTAAIEAELFLAGAAGSHASWPTGAGVPPSVALSPDGSLGTIAWLDQIDYNAYAVSWNPASGWGQPLLMSTGTAQYTAVWGTGVSLANGPGQSSTAVWLGVAGTNYQIKILGSTYMP